MIGTDKYERFKSDILWTIREEFKRGEEEIIQLSRFLQNQPATVTSVWPVRYNVYIFDGEANLIYQNVKKIELVTEEHERNTFRINIYAND